MEKAKTRFHGLIRLVIFTLLTAVQALALNTTYYIDCDSGSDNNNGTSSTSAWESLSKVNGTTFEAGDSILFKTDCAWTGMLEPQGSGSSEAQITIGKYGTGAKPHIAGNGADAGVTLDGQEYWTIQDLEITNQTAQRAVRSGIRVLAKPTGLTRRIRILNNEIHDVTGDNRRPAIYRNGGVYLYLPGSTSAQNHFEDVLIEGNYIHDALTSGVRVAESGMNLNYYHSNVVVRNNIVSNVGSDGMVISHCDNPIIEYNSVLDPGGLGNRADTKLIAGIWMSGTKDAVFQNNEVARTRLFDDDGNAFDTDWGAGGTIIFQYNYSHGNEGGFWLDCARCALSDPSHEKTILRYNISVDDVGYISRNGVNPAEFYNNVFYNSSGNMDTHRGNRGNQYIFQNNIFAYQTSPNWGTATYENNLYYPIPKNPSDAEGISEDPLFVNPGPAEDGIDFADNFKLQPESPCIDAGMMVADNGGVDFWGTALSDGKPDIGAHEYTPFVGILPEQNSPGSGPVTRILPEGRLIHGAKSFDIRGKLLRKNSE